MPGALTVNAKREMSSRQLRKRAIKLAADTGREYVLVVRQMEPPALSESLDITFSGQGPPPGLTTPFEVVRLYADGREEPVRALRFTGVDRRVLRDIAGASGGVAMDILDGPPGPGRFQIGATGGIPVRWEVPSVLITEMELLSRTGGEPRVLVPPPFPAAEKATDAASTKAP